MKKVVTFGEIMLRLSAPDYLRLNQSDNLIVSFAGSEANVAVSLANYGVPVEYITRMPQNPIAEKCINEIRGYKVCVDNCLVGGDRLGLMYVEKGAVSRPSRVFYDRAESSFSQIKPGMIDWNGIFDNAMWFHWSGITPALSQSAADTLMEAVERAAQKNIYISCDLNFRQKLWKYGKKPSEIMTDLVKHCDLIMGNEEDCEMMFGIKPESFDANQTDGEINQESFKSVCEQMMKKFPKCKKMVVTLRGAINANHNTWCSIMYYLGKLIVSQKYDITHIVDRIGGGDSFMGALIYGLINYNDDKDALEFATAASCLKHTIIGDYNQVSIEEVESLMTGNKSGRVKR